MVMHRLVLYCNPDSCQLYHTLCDLLVDYDDLHGRKSDILLLYPYSTRY